MGWVCGIFGNLTFNQPWPNLGLHLTPLRKFLSS